MKTTLSTGMIRQSRLPCPEAATLGAQGATASAVPALYGQAPILSTHLAIKNDSFLTEVENPLRQSSALSRFGLNFAPSPGDKTCRHPGHAASIA